MLSCSELYLFFFCLIRESIASQHRNAYCGWEVAAAYALFKHEHKNGAFYENERERAIATHLSNDTKKEEEICLISLHFFPSRCGFSSIRFDNLQSMSFSVNNNRLKCISVAQCRMSIVSNLNRSARTRKHSTLSEVYSCSHIQYCGSFFIRAYISILIQLSIGQPFYMNLMWLKSILCDINYSNSIFGWCFVSSLSLFSRCI